MQNSAGLLRKDRNYLQLRWYTRARFGRAEIPKIPITAIRCHPVMN
jgi:hypothetical protein